MGGVTNLGPYLPPKLVPPSSDQPIVHTSSGWQRLFARTGELEFDHGLHIRDNVLLWTTGERLTRKFTFPFPVDDAHMLDFPNSESTGEPLSILNMEIIWSIPVSHLCVLHRDELMLRVYETSTGQDFHSPMPCRVSSLWPTPYGILIQRDVVNRRSLFVEDSMNQSFSAGQVCISFIFLQIELKISHNSHNIHQKYGNIVRHNKSSEFVERF